MIEPVVIGNATLYCGDSRDVLRGMAENSVDSVVCDPPYELGFMNKKWDNTGIANDSTFWAEVFRVLKPGGHLLAFSGSRTYHRMACAIEDSGFEIRDQIMWVYGSGFPKSHDVSKAIDKAAGATREKVRVDSSAVRNPKASGGGRDGASGATRPWIESAMERGYHEKDSDTAVTEAAKHWQGWGTALKPAHEPICVARKPLIGNVAENVLAHGTGALNIDGCRVETDEYIFNKGRVKPYEGQSFSRQNAKLPHQTDGQKLGRWPANFIHDGLTEDWARYFYCAKASKKDRDEGLDGFEESRHSSLGYERGLGDAGEGMFKDRNPLKRNGHPTIKPTELMRYLCRLVTPPGGLVLDPFMGSGSTGKAAMLEGFRFAGIDMTEEYFRISVARIEHAQRQRDLFL